MNFIGPTQGDELHLQMGFRAEVISISNKDRTAILKEGLGHRGIKAGTYWSEASPIDLAPTFSALLGIEFPAGREGHVLTEALLQP